MALDAVMDRLRQEATEAGLKDGLKKALQMLDAMRTRFVKLLLSQPCRRIANDCICVA